MNKFLIFLILFLYGANTLSAEQTSIEFARYYNASVSAYRTHDFEKSLSAAIDANKIANSPFEKKSSLKLILVVAAASSNVPLQQEALEALLQLSDLSPVEITEFKKALAHVSLAVVEDGKKKCVELGFTPGTEKFGTCVLQLTK